MTNKHYNIGSKSIRKSIKIEYTLIFSLLLFGCIFLISVLNFLTLGKVYLNHKQKVLVSSYREIDEAAKMGDINSNEFDESLKKVATVNNMEVLVLDSDTETIKSTNRDSSLLARHLLEYIFSIENEVKPKVKTEHYQIQQTQDPTMKLEYLELWGTLSSGELIIMRTPVESVHEASYLANMMFVRLGIAVSILGMVLIWIVSKKITLPIMNLVQISEMMTKLDFSKKYEKGKGNEVDVLGEHMNELSGTLENTILELKSANAALKRDIERKIEIDEMRTDFLSNVSHELKTPIALIQGYAEGLKDCVNDDAESRDFYCDVIMDEAGKMNVLVKSLLTLNELEFGNGKVEMEHFDVNELIHNCVAAMDIMIKQNDINVVLPDTSCMVWADELKVETILNNYLSNAIHYCEGERRIEIVLTRDDSHVKIGVFNTGQIIAEDEMDKLWTKFYKTDKARTREYGGSGIGLSLVKACMDAMGGKYGVTNGNDGVWFWFELDAQGNES